MRYVDQDGAARLASNLVPATRTVNGKVLTADITLGASDVSAYTKDEVDAKLEGFSTDVYSVGATAPSNTKLLWVDTGNNAVLKYYDSSSSSWKAVAAAWG